jgi:NAD(P)-dependent dehydrogenase (short-subunit alcohol dehydrogenase family)
MPGLAPGIFIWTTMSKRPGSFRLIKTTAEEFDMARVALVTGGTRGIGATISKALKGAGYKVAASYAGNDAARSKAMTWFLVQLALNALWSPVFFGWHRTRTALIIIVALLVALAATIITAARVDRAAAWLLAPYLIWVAYATTVNAGVVVMN